MLILNDITNFKSSNLTINKLDKSGYPVLDASNKIVGYSSQCIDHNYIAFVKDGAGCGRLFLCPKKTNVLGTLGILIPKNIDINYLFYYLHQISFNKFKIGSTIPHIYYSDIQKIKIPKIDKNKQEKIGSFFKELDELIELEKIQINKMTYAFNFFNFFLMKHFNIKFSEKLFDVCNVYQPKTISAKDLNEQGKYQVYGANGKIGCYNEYNIDIDLTSISCRGEKSGKINFIPAFSWVTGNSMIVKSKNEEFLLNKYIFYLLKTMNIKKYVSGGAQPQITKDNLKNISLNIHSISDQSKIIKILDLFQELIHLNKNKVELLEKVKKHFLQTMFCE